MVVRLARKLVWVLVAAHLWAAPCLSEPRPKADTTVTYSVYTQPRDNNHLRVEAEFPAECFTGSDRTLALPVWTPGSYKVRDFSKSISAMQLLDGGPARLEKSAKNRWHVVGDFPADQPLRVSYLVYGHELSVRTNFFSPELSLLIGAATFVAPAPLKSERLSATEFVVRFPELTDQISTALPRSSSAELSFQASGYDQLVDSPVLFGDLDEQPFQAGGKPHFLVHAGDRRYWDLGGSLRDATKVVETVQSFWGQIPYQDYHIFNLITESRGGLEHASSCVLGTSRFATRDREKYVDWLALVGHEYFHAWNAKRLRPKALGPFDYETEVTTPSLWITEGLTSYYDELLVRRAGLSTRAEYLKALSGQLNTLLNTPGRKSLPLTTASFDAWIRSYQPTDNSINDDISYYTKGAVVGWLLDTEIRRRSSGAKTLDMALREAYRAFSAQGFEEAEFRAEIGRSSGLDLDKFFSDAVDSTQELSIAEALDYWGLEWKPEDSKVAAEPYLGAGPNTADPRLIDNVAAGSPAALGGVTPGDELLALDGNQVPTTGPAGILKYLKVGGTYPLLVSRMGRVKEYTVTLTAQPAAKSVLKVKAGKGGHPDRLEAWLGPETTVPGEKTL